MNQGWTYREQVGPQSAGLTLLEYYTQRYRHSTSAEWQSRIKAGQVLLDGGRTTAETPLKQGQWLTYNRPPWEEPEVPLTFEVLYEDADLLVIAKPSGLPVLPGGGFLEHTLLHQVKQHFPQGTPVPIHRLGRGTSGLMILARSPLARSSLSQQMRDRQIRKTYRALVGSGAIADRFTLNFPIGKVPHPVLGDVYAATSQGLPSSSDCRVLRRTTETTLLEVIIHTGRPHQIRIHLAAAGYPLLGDPLYRSGGIPEWNQADKIAVPGDCGYHLHAVQVNFIHPRSQRSMELFCPPPPDLQ